MALYESVPRPGLVGIREDAKQAEKMLLRDELMAAEVRRRSAPSKFATHLR